MSASRSKREALEYHSRSPKGKIEVVPTKPYGTQRDLSLAYSPGVAKPCLEIKKDQNTVYDYTAKGNLVAVISNGTAVLGLGDIGPLASKPVMEGKGLLFKVFADIDVFDIEIDASDVDKFVDTVKAIAPTFGGINLEDIKAPEAFEIERRLKAELDIPVMHDDQHGTAIITSAALLNCLEIIGKKIENIKIVCSGAGAAAMSCMELYQRMGAKRENIVMTDSKGVIRIDREKLSAMKAQYATDRDISTMEEAMNNADLFLGLSMGNLVNKKMVKSMAKDPIVFALANPDPEISYRDAKDAREDVIVGTGRSDHPNQVNNVLGFPYIFRGALDVRSTAINEQMKLAAVRAIADLAKEPVPDEVNEAYGMQNIHFGRDMVIPKPMDSRLITWVSRAVAKAAVDSGVAKLKIDDWDEYEKMLERRLGTDNSLIRNISQRAQLDPKRVVYAEGDNFKILKAAEAVLEEGIAIPILLGNRKKIKAIVADNNLGLEGVEIIDPKAEDMSHKRDEFGKLFFEKRKRKGLTEHEAIQLMRGRNFYGAMLVDTGVADAVISGMTRNYPKVIRPALQILGLEKGANLVAGMYILQSKNGPIFFADTTVNVDPSADQLVEIALLMERTVRELGIIPRMAFLSYSNYGSSKGPDPDKMAKAVKMLKEQKPGLIVDGELQANFALNKERLKEVFPFSDLKQGNVNTLIFPNLSAGNISFMLIKEITGLDNIGPILLGMRKSFNVLQLNCSVREIINVTTLAVVDAQSKV